MEFLVNRPHPAKIDMCVLLCRLNRCVPKKFLDYSDIGPPGKQMGCKTMAKRVWADRSGCADAQCVFFHKFPKSLTSERFSRTGQEKREPRILPPQRKFSDVSQNLGTLHQPGGAGRDRPFPERNHPLFVPFTKATAEAFLRLIVTKGERGDLGSAATGSVKHFKDGTVTKPVAVPIRNRGAQKSIDLTQCQHRRNPLPEFRAFEKGR